MRIRPFNQPAPRLDQLGAIERATPSYCSSRASTLAAQMKSFSDSPLMAWVEKRTRQ
jgi:hypothetical protein